MEAVDLTSRESGLLPLWIVPLVVLVWGGALALAVNRRYRWLGVAGEIGAAGALLLAHLLFFWRPLLSAAHVPRGGGDLNSFFFPLHAYGAARIQAGEFPLWNPHVHAGMPHLANFQAAILYPPNLIAYLLARPFTYGTMELMALFHYLVASFGAYALARTLGLGRVASLTAGIVFAYSGFMVAHLGHYSMISAAAWLPLLLLAVRLMTLRASWFWALSTALVVFVMTAGGHQQTLLYSLTFAAAWWIFWVVRGHHLMAIRDWATATRDRALIMPLIGDAARFGGAVATGIGLAAPMVLPSLQLGQLSVRSAISYEQSTDFSIQPVALVHFILPTVFGSNPTDYWGSFSSGEIWGYAGIATLILAAIGLAVRPTPTRLFLAGATVVALLYALGPWTPIQGWAFRFGPLYDLVRAPARIYLVLDLSLALLAAYGLHEITRRDGTGRLTRVLRATTRALIVTLAAFILFVLPLFYSLILSTNDPSNRPVITIDNLNLLVIYLGATLALLWAVLRGYLGGAPASGLLLILIVIDLFGVTSRFNPTPDDLVTGFRHPEVIEFLRKESAESDPFRIESATGRVQPDLAMVTGLEDIGGLFDPMQPAAYTAVRQAAQGNRGRPLYDLLNGRFLVLDVESEAPGDGFSEVLTTEEGIVIWENEEVMPRAWLAWDADRVEQQTAIDAVRSETFDPHTDLYITGDIETAEAGGSGEAQITRHDAEEIRVSVQTNRPAYLVLAELDYPGWTAMIDGEEVPIATANGIFRAITVPAGQHEVMFRFESNQVRAGFGLSIISLLAGIGMLTLGYRQRRMSRVQGTLGR